MTALVWFTRDLRVHDHPALCAALEAHERVIPVFCLDDRLLHGRHASGPRTQFMLECLRELNSALHERGSGLVIRHGASTTRPASSSGSTPTAATRGATSASCGRCRMSCSPSRGGCPRRSRSSAAA